jgi:hypothetical protein
MSRGFSQTGFNPLQRHDAFAFEITLSRSRQDRFGSKTVLNPESILHDPSQSFVLNFCHASNVTDESHNRKLKIHLPCPLMQKRREPFDPRRSPVPPPD